MAGDERFKPGDLAVCVITYTPVKTSLALRVADLLPPENASDRLTAVGINGQPYAIDTKAEGVELRRMRFLEKWKHSNLPRTRGNRVAGYGEKGIVKYKPLDFLYIPPLKLKAEIRNLDFNF